MSWTAPRTWEALAKLYAAELNEQVRDNLNFLKVNIALEIASGITIVGGVITKTQTHHVIQSESGTEDDLATINGGAEGDVLLLRAEVGHIITVKHGTGNILSNFEIIPFLDGDIYTGVDIDITEGKYVMFVFNGDYWITVGCGLSGEEVENLIDSAIETHKVDSTPHDSSYLNKVNTTPFTSTEDYHPATKKYVDDNAGGASAFPDLTDVPASYEDQGGKIVSVKATEDGLEFIEGGGGGGTVSRAMAHMIAQGS